MHHRKVNPELVLEIVKMLPTMGNAEISRAIDEIISPDQVGNIRAGRSWSGVTGIRPPVEPSKAPKPYCERKPNYKQTHPKHPLYKITTAINEGVSLRVLALIRERGITNAVASAALQMTDSATQGKLYRKQNAFSIAQILILHKTIFPDVDLVWLLTGVYDGDDQPDYVQLTEFFELQTLVDKLKREALNAEKQ